MCIDFAAGWTQIIGHDISRAVWQHLEITHVLACSFDVVRQDCTALLCAYQLSTLAEFGDADGRMFLIAGSVVVLITADAGDQDLIVELVESSLVDVAADSGVTAELQTAVALDLILHEETIVIGGIAAVRIDGGCHIQILPVNEQCFAVYLCFRRVTNMVCTVIEVLKGLIEVIAAVLFDVVL